ncbi:MAG: hypothetical protein KatS3mg082_3218 [Nitrospiraceae bacterium]|nr:MAG: hypothetical protein KatS3mg082_3218 [Nitrospiraceae bacterium]
MRDNHGTQLACSGPCGTCYPVVDGIPVLINEKTSIFSIDDFVRGRETFFRRRGRLWRWLDRLIPSAVLNVGSARNYRDFTRAVHGLCDRPRVLVVGGSVPGAGMEALLDDDRIDLVETDVSLGPRTQLIADAHDIPFADGTFDGAVAQAVLEHVIEPARCVAELHRVLTPGGFLYVEMPFMQPVHGGRYDFTRLTHSGLRWLLAEFEEVSSGAVCGPGSAATYALTYFLRSFGTSRMSRALLYRVGLLATFWLKYFDLFLVRRVAALDAASSIFFLARKSGTRVSPREVVSAYRGGHA